MSDKFYILTDKGFLLPSDLKGTKVLLPSGFYKDYKEEPKSNSFYKKIKFILYTGTEVTIDPDRKVKGLTFTPNEIKNELENLKASEYKLDDYLFTPYLDVSYYPKKISINLTEYLNKPVTDKHRIYYTSKNVYSEYKNNGFTMYNLLSVLTGKVVKDDVRAKVLKFLETKNIDLFDSSSVDSYITELINDCTKTTLANMSISKRTMDFLVISILRGTVQHLFLQNNFVFKTISYKFNKDQPYHTQMYEDLILFLRGMDIEYEEKEYDHYTYLNFSCEPLIGYLEHFKKTNFSDLNKFSTIDTRYFINILYRYTNNSFYSNLDTYLNLKQQAYYSKIVLGYSDKLHSNYDSQLPINSFILEEPTLLDFSTPDVIKLEDGYLVRIVDIVQEVTQGYDDLHLEPMPIY